MFDEFRDLIDPAILRNALFSAALLAATLLVRARMTARITRGQAILSRNQRAALIKVRMGSGVVVALGLFAIWFSELHSLLLSLTAVLVAAVMATKELIQCATGSLLRTAGGAYRIGDHVEVDGVVGEIIDHNLLTTVLAEMETGAFGHRPTGRSLVLPNSHFFAGAVRIRRFGRHFVSHSFAITCDTKLSANEVLAAMNRLLTEACEPFAVLAARYHRSLERHLGVKLGGPEPRVALGTNDLGKLRVEVSLFCRTEDAFAIQQHLTTEFLDLANGHQAANARRSFAPPRVVTGGRLAAAA